VIASRIGVLAQVELKQRLGGAETRRVVRQHGEKLQRRGAGDAGAPAMGHVADAEGRGHVGDLLALRKPAGGAGVGLGDVDETLGEEPAEAEARERALAAGDRDRRAGLDLAIAAVILGRDRLLEPADVEVLDGARVAQRVDGVVGVVGIDHEPVRLSYQPCE